jgi:hypothetical protein
MKRKEEAAVETSGGEAGDAGDARSEWGFYSPVKDFIHF